jgi:hypothetical protein
MVDMQKLFLSLLAGLFLVSCTGDSTASRMASDACNCFQPESDDLGDQSRKILIRAFRSNDWETTMAAELGKIRKEEEKAVVIRELESALNRQSFQKCMNRVDIKYSNRRFDQKMASQLAEEMGDIDNCELGAAFMDYASKHEMNFEMGPGGDEEEDDFETPAEEDSTILEE